MINRVKKYIFLDKLRSETFWALVVKFVSIIFGVVFVVVVPRMWGVDVYGVFSLLLAYITILEIFFGNSINTAIKRDIAKYGFSEKSIRVIVGGIKIKLFFFFSGFSLLVVANLLKILPEVLSQNFVIFASLLFLMNFWGLMINIFEAAHDNLTVVHTYLFEYSAKILLLIAFIYLGKTSLYSLLYVFVGGYSIALFFVTIKIIAKFKIKLSDLLAVLSTDETKSMIVRTFHLALVTVSAVLLTRIDLVILAFFVDDLDVGQYSIAVELTRNAAILSTAIVTGALPLFALNSYRGVFKKVFKKITVINIFLMVIFILFAIFGVSLFYGEGHSTISYLIVMFSVYPLLISVQSLTTEVMNLRGATKFLFKNGVVAVVCNIVLSLALVQAFGVYGVAVATLVSYIVWVVLNLKTVFSMG